MRKCVELKMGYEIFKKKKKMGYEYDIRNGFLDFVLNFGHE